MGYWWLKTRYSRFSHLDCSDILLVLQSTSFSLSLQSFCYDCLPSISIFPQNNARSAWNSPWMYFNLIRYLVLNPSNILFVLCFFINYEFRTIMIICLIVSLLLTYFSFSAFTLSSAFFSSLTPFHYRIKNKILQGHPIWYTVSSSLSFHRLLD